MENMKNPFRVVIIDDVVDVCDFYKVILEKNLNKDNIQIEVYYDAENGLKRIYKNSFDLAIIDVQLNSKDLDGLSLARECILMGKPVIINTATSWSNKWIFYLKNFDLKKDVVYLQKDIRNPKKIIDVVKKFMEKNDVRKFNCDVGGVFKSAHFVC